jgi:hypothetical protein
MGFIDSMDYGYESISGKRYYAFVGDSFTAGYHGGDAWVPKIREKIKSPMVEIYNLGVAGTSFEHYYRLLNDVRTTLHLTHIVIVAISDDFTRVFWHPFLSGGKINFCPNANGHEYCSDDTFGAKIFPFNSSQEEIVRFASYDIRERAIKRKLQESTWYYLASKSHLLYYVRKATEPNLWNLEITREERNIATLKNIKDSFPDIPIVFMHLPEKGEVLNKKYRTVNLRPEIEALGMQYFPALEKCSWTNDMYFQNDSHPNSKGYENISNCVSKYLFAQ